MEYMENILFICMGNICRSPSAEAVMQRIVKNNGMEKEIFDSEKLSRSLKIALQKRNV